MEKVKKSVKEKVQGRPEIKWGNGRSAGDENYTQTVYIIRKCPPDRPDPAPKNNQQKSDVVHYDEKAFGKWQVGGF